MEIKDSCIKAWKKTILLMIISLFVLPLINKSSSQNLTEDSFEKFSDRNLKLFPLNNQVEGEYITQYPQIINKLAISVMFDKANPRFFKRVSQERIDNPQHYLIAIAGKSFFRVYFGNTLDLNDPNLEFIEQFNTPNEITALDFFPGDSLVAYGDNNGNIIAWEIRGYKTDVKKGKKIQPKLGSLTRTQRSHTRKVTSIAFSKDGKYLLSGGEDYKVKEWDIYRYQTTTLYQHKNIVTRVRITQDGQYVISSGYDKQILFYNKKTRKAFPLQSNDPNNTIKHEGWISDFAISPDGTQLVSVGYDRKVLLWDITDFKNVTVQELGKHNTNIHVVIFSNDGQTIATGAEDGTIIFWKGNKKDRVIREHNSVILGLAFSPNNDLFFSSDNQGKLVIQKP